MPRNNRAVELARARRWAEAETVLDDARPLVVESAVFRRNASMIDLNAGTSGGSRLSEDTLLHYVFAGEWADAVGFFRDIPVGPDLFVEAPPYMDAAAPSWGRYGIPPFMRAIFDATAAARAVAPARPEVGFLHAWSAFHLDPDTTAASSTSWSDADYRIDVDESAVRAEPNASGLYYGHTPLHLTYRLEQTRLLLDAGRARHLRILQQLAGTIPLLRTEGDRDMRVYLGPFRHGITGKHLLWRLRWFGISPEKIHDIDHWLSSTRFGVVRRWITAKTKRERTVRIKIHEWDTWDVAHTLAHIVVPLLIQFRDGPFGPSNDCPQTWKHDAPDEFRDGGSDGGANAEGEFDFHLERWEWIVDEMIWALTRVRDGDMDPYDDVARARKDRGLRLFGKYFTAIWE